MQIEGFTSIGKHRTLKKENGWGRGSAFRKMRMDFEDRMEEHSDQPDRSSPGLASCPGKANGARAIRKSMFTTPRPKQRVRIKRLLKMYARRKDSYHDGKVLSVVKPSYPA